MSRRFALLSLCFALVLCAGALASTHDAYSAPRAGFSTADGVLVEDTAVYSTGYVSMNGSEWSAFSLTGDRVRGDWVLGSASSNVDLSDIRYVAIFSCTWSDGWDCSDTWQVKDRGPQTGPGTLDSIEGDYQALQDFYAAMDGPGWNDNTGWQSMTPQTMGDAFGVTVYPDGHEYAGRVKELGLSGDPDQDTKDVIGNGLVGDHVPDSFGNLKKMTHLRLKGNSITARIDNWVPQLDSIVKLSLSNSQDITGQTDFGYEDQTQYNHPSKSPDAYNLWQGPFPEDLSMLTQLELLEIGNAELTGSLPTHLPDSIVAFVAGNNHLSGTLPAWENAVRMTHLYLQNRYDTEGKFTGPVPEEWNNMKDMAWFIINHNDLSGDFPEMGNWRDLEQFLIGGNDFTGTEPSHWLFNETDKSLSIDEVGVGGNAWDTEVSPNWVSGRSGIYVYSNYNNEPDQTGMIPKWIGEKNTRQLLWSLNAFTHFEEGSFIPARNKLYWFDRNNISGTLPPIQEPWDSAQFRVRFWSNNFTGEIPDWSGATSVATTDVYVHLHDNQLEGVIPAFFGDFDPSAFGSFTVHDNKFTPKDILPHRAAIQAAADDYQYLPQKPFGQTETVSVGATIDRSSFAYTGNAYQWLKDGVALSAETGPTIDTSPYGPGEYVLEIVHPDIDFTFTSDPVTVRATSGPDSKSGDEEALEALYSSTDGASWSNNGGWSSSGMDLNDDIFGITTQTIDGEPRVTKVDLVANNLDGQLPEALANLKQATRLDVKRNQLSGELPDGIGEMRKLRYLSLSGRNTDDEEFDGVHAYNKKHGGRATNQYVGGLPDSYYDLVDLEFFELDGQDKQFGGTLGPGVGNWTKLKRIFIQGNLWYESREDQVSEPTAWGGTIPSEVKAWKDNEMFIAGDNKWTGVATDAFEGWNDIPRRIAFGIDGWGTPEEFRQPLPDMSHLSKLEYLSIGHIPWTGPYPEYLHDFKENGFIKLDYAEFDDQDLPPFEDMGDLFRLDFSYMTTDGVLFPPGTDVSGDMNRMILFSVRHSNLKGVIPDGMDAWDRLRYARFHSTDIQGPLPEQPPGKHSPSLVGLHFNNMPNLRGGIPAAWGEVGSSENYGGVIETGTFTDFGTDASGDHWVEDDSKNWQTDELVGGPDRNGPQVRYPDATFAHNRKILSNTNNRIYYQYDHVYKNQSLTNLQVGGEYSIVWNSNTDERDLTSISFSNSNLDGLIEPGAAPVNMEGGSYDVSDNRLTFADLVPSMQEFEDLSSQNGWTYRYAPQKPFGAARSASVSAGGSFTHDFSSEVSHADNVYQWEKDGSDVPGQTSNVLSLSSVDAGDAGTYRLRVTNPGAPALTLYSSEVELSVS